MKKNQHNVESDKLKGVLITRTAIKTLIPEDIVEKVIMFQFKEVKDATHTHEQIEVTGFGKFMTSPSKIKRKKQKLELAIQALEKKIENNPSEAPLRVATWKKIHSEATDTLEYVKTKKGGYEHKPKRDIGGSMELHIREEGDRGDSQ